MTETIRGQRESNVPSDMQADPPVPCAFKVGQRVVYTNCQGVTFDRVVRGFASSPHGHPTADRFVYLDSDSWWFPVQADRLQAFSR